MNTVIAMRHVLLATCVLTACGGKAPPPPSNSNADGTQPYARSCVKAETGCMQLDCLDATAAELIKEQGTAGCRTGDGTPFNPSEHDRAVHACREQATCAATSEGCEWTWTAALETCLANAPLE